MHHFRIPKLDHCYLELDLRFKSKNKFIRDVFSTYTIKHGHAKFGIWTRFEMVCASTSFTVSHLSFLLSVWSFVRAIFHILQHLDTQSLIYGHILWCMAHYDTELGLKCRINLFFGVFPKLVILLHLVMAICGIPILWSSSWTHEKVCLAHVSHTTLPRHVKLSICAKLQKFVCIWNARVLTIGTILF